MTDLNQLVEVGALAVVRALQQIEPNVRVDSLTSAEEESIARAHLAAILLLLADDLAGVAAKVILDARTGKIDTDLRSIGYILDQAIRTRIAAIIEGEGK